MVITPQIPSTAPLKSRRSSNQITDLDTIRSNLEKAIKGQNVGRMFSLFKAYIKEIKLRLEGMSDYNSARTLYETFLSVQDFLNNATEYGQEARDLFVEVFKQPGIELRIPENCTLEYEGNTITKITIFPIGADAEPEGVTTISENPAGNNSVSDQPLWVQGLTIRNVTGLTTHIPGSVFISNKQPEYYKLTTTDPDSIPSNDDPVISPDHTPEKPSPDDPIHPNHTPPNDDPVIPPGHTPETPLSDDPTTIDLIPLTDDPAISPEHHPENPLHDVPTTGYPLPDDKPVILSTHTPKKPINKPSAVTAKHYMPDLETLLPSIKIDTDSFLIPDTVTDTMLQIFTAIGIDINDPDDQGLMTNIIENIANPLGGNASYDFLNFLSSFCIIAKDNSSYIDLITAKEMLANNDMLNSGLANNGIYLDYIEQLIDGGEPLLKYPGLEDLQFTYKKTGPTPYVLSSTDTVDILTNNGDIKSISSTYIVINKMSLGTDITVAVSSIKNIVNMDGLPEQAGIITGGGVEVFDNFSKPLKYGDYGFSANINVCALIEKEEAKFDPKNIKAYVYNSKKEKWVQTYKPVEIVVMQGLDGEQDKTFLISTIGGLQSYIFVNDGSDKQSNLDQLETESSNNLAEQINMELAFSKIINSKQIDYLYSFVKSEIKKELGISYFKNPESGKTEATNYLKENVPYNFEESSNDV